MDLERATFQDMYATSKIDYKPCFRWRTYDPLPFVPDLSLRRRDPARLLHAVLQPPRVKRPHGQDDLAGVRAARIDGAEAGDDGMDGGVED